MIINPPCIVTARLLPGVQIGKAFLSIEYSGLNSKRGRVGYLYHIDLEDYAYTNHDLHSGCGGGNLQQGLESLLSFLDAFAEACWYTTHQGHKSENTDLFPDELKEWAMCNSNEFGMLRLELEENPNVIVEG
jgi:hypothetical protein